MRAYLKIKMAAERQRLRRVLNRFKKEELPNVVRWLGGKENVSKKRSKKDIVSSTVDACVVTELSPHTITELELQFWAPSAAEADPQVFYKRFQVYLGDEDFHLADALRSPYHWLALHITKYGCAAYTCYLIRCPLSPVVLLARVRKSHVSWILDALCLTIECSEWQDSELSGKSLESLLDLLLNQSSQGPYSAYRLNQKDPNPLLAVRRKRNRTRPDNHSHESEEQRKRQKAADDVFGTNPLPKLEKFIFKLQSPLPGDHSDSFHCTVKLAGTNVLEGVKQCMLSDLISLPVPDTITGMCSSGSNSIRVVHSANGVKEPSGHPVHRLQECSDSVVEGSAASNS